MKFTIKTSKVNRVSIEEKLAVIRKYDREKSSLLRMLLDLQSLSDEGFIDEETASLVAEEMNMTEAKIYEVLSFYSMLKTTPQAKYCLKVCNSSPCHFSNAQFIFDVLENELGIKTGEVTKDGLFSYEAIPCCGACEVGPVLKLKDQVYGDLTEEKIHELVHQLKADALRQEKGSGSDA